MGLHHIQVGRADEVAALLHDIDNIADGGSSIRFLIGEYGSGKTFFLYLTYTIAQERRLVTAHADLNPDRRLHASGGQARSLYAELMRNISTRSKPDGGAMPNIAERFITDALKQARELDQTPEQAIDARLHALAEMVGGYDFALVIEAYWRAHDSGNERLKADAVRWLRGEFTAKTDARKALGVRTIVDDANFYDHLKLMARFVRQAGFAGLMVGFDELVNLYKLSNAHARRSNYEQILRILNDTLQGSVEGLGVLMGGTPELLMDPRRGLYSYEALQLRLAENSFARDGLKDMSGPVIRLANLAPEDLFILLTKLRDVVAMGEPEDYLLPDEALHAFLEHCSKCIGDAYFRTPRNTIKAFVDLLTILDQNPNTAWEDLVGGVRLEADQEAAAEPDELAGADSGDQDGGLAGFRL